MKPQLECSHQEQLEQLVQEAIMLEYPVESMKLQLIVSALPLTLKLFVVTAYQESSNTRRNKRGCDLC